MLQYIASLKGLALYDNHNIVMYRIARNFGGGKLWRIWRILEIRQI